MHSFPVATRNDAARFVKEQAVNLNKAAAADRRWADFTVALVRLAKDNYLGREARAFFELDGIYDEMKGALIISNSDAVCPIARPEEFLAKADIVVKAARNDLEKITPRGQKLHESPFLLDRTFLLEKLFGKPDSATAVAAALTRIQGRPR